MGEVEARFDVAMWRRRRDPCGGHRERRSLLEGLLPVLLACLLYVGIFGDVAHGSTDVYDKLESFGFPSGLLPHIVKDYELDSNGKFTLYLEGKCEIDIPSLSFPVVYSEKITGTVSYGSLQNLSGIQVKLFYFWISITAIEVDGDSLRFEVGYFSASYPIHPNFDENPGCVNILFSEPEALGYLDGYAPESLGKGSDPEIRAAPMIVRVVDFFPHLGDRLSLCEADSAHAFLRNFREAMEGVMKYTIDTLSHCVRP